MAKAIAVAQSVSREVAVKGVLPDYRGGTQPAKKPRVRARDLRRGWVSSFSFVSWIGLRAHTRMGARKLRLLRLGGCRRFA